MPDNGRTPTPVPGGLFEPIEDEETPVEIPEARVVNGADTGELMTSLVEATTAAGQISDEARERAISSAIIKLGEYVAEKGSGNGGGSGPIDLKKFSKKNWIVNTLIALVVAGSGAFAAYKATEQRSKDNKAGVRENKAAIQDLDKNVDEVKSKVKAVDDKLIQQIEVQGKLVEGVEGLKEEARTEKQKRLEEEVEQLRRENRQLERERRRRD